MIREEIAQVKRTGLHCGKYGFLAIGICSRAKRKSPAHPPERRVQVRRRRLVDLFINAAIFTTRPSTARKQVDKSRGATEKAGNKVACRSAGRPAANIGVSRGARKPGRCRVDTHRRRAFERNTDARHQRNEQRTERLRRVIPLVHNSTTGLTAVTSQAKYPSR